MLPGESDEGLEGKQVVAVVEPGLGFFVDDYGGFILTGGIGVERGLFGEGIRFGPDYRSDGCADGGIPRQRGISREGCVAR